MYLVHRPCSPKVAGTGWSTGFPSHQRQNAPPLCPSTHPTPLLSKRVLRACSVPNSVQDARPEDSEHKGRGAPSLLELRACQGRPWDSTCSTRRRGPREGVWGSPAKASNLAWSGGLHNGLWNPCFSLGNRGF